jgi:hypothetical protein
VAGYRSDAPAQARGTSPLEAALFTRFLIPHTLVENSETQQVLVCLGHGTWAALGWPTQVLGIDDVNMATYVLSKDGSALFFHVKDPGTWREIPFRAVLVAAGVALKQTGVPEPIVKARLRQPQSLAYDDLHRLAGYLEIERAHLSRAQLLQAAAIAVGDGDEDFVRQVQKSVREAVSKPVEVMADDPTFQAAYEDMEPDDRREFPEVRAAIKRGNLRRHVHDWRVRLCVLQPWRRRPRRAPAAVRGSLGEEGEQRRKRRRVEVPPEAVALPDAHPEPNVLPGGVAALPVASEADAELAAEEVAARPHVPRQPRAEPWGAGSVFVLAKHYSGGNFKAWSVTCGLHDADRQRCNKYLALGSSLSSEEAQLRIKEWCVRGHEKGIEI